MATPAPVRVVREISASADEVWALVTDLPRMGEWSPENTGGRWAQGATGPAVGAHFIGTNENGPKRWSTDVEVVSFEAPHTFAFKVTVKGFPVAHWNYEIETTPEGCRVTETWTDNRMWFARVIGGWVSGVKERSPHNTAGMESTLARLAAAAQG